MGAAMSDIEPGKSIETTKPIITISGRALKAGRYRFRLVVVNERGVASAPDELEVVVSGRSPIGVVPAAAKRSRRRTKKEK
jgi:hypothetical protein